MSDKEDKPLAPVFHGEKDKTNARQISGRTIDPFGFEKHYRTDSDGAVTRLETKGGMPQVIVDIHDEEKPADKLPRGLCAYPFSGDATWSKPCVITWSDGLDKWKTNFYNPPQTKRGIANPPTVSALHPTYWVNEDGGTCIASGDRIFYGGRHSKFAYKKWKMSKVSGEYPLIPFLHSKTHYFFSVPSAERTVLKKLDGSTVLDHYKTKNYGSDGEKPYNIQLPMSVSDTGTLIATQSASEYKWGTPGPGSYDAITSKAYFVTRLTLPEITIIQSEVDLQTYWHGSGTHAADSGEDDFVGDVGKCHGVTLILSGGGGAVGGFVLSCSMSGAYDMTHWMPPHQPMNVDDYFGSELSGRRHGYRIDSYALDVSNSTTIGYVAVGNSIAPVVVVTDASINQDLHADGKLAEGVTTYSPGVGGATAFAGQTKNGEKVTSVNNSANDLINITVNIGPLSVAIFTHSGSGSASGNTTASAETSGFIGGYSGAYYYEGYPGQHAARNGGADGDGVGTEPDGAVFGPPCYGSYVIFEGAKYYDTGCVAALMSKPAFFEQLNLSDACNVSYTTEGTVGSVSDKNKIDAFKSPYSGGADFNGKSKTILCADANLNFVAYIEAEISSSCSFSSSTWDISETSASLVTPHVVKYTAVIEYQGAQYRQELINTTVTKPGPWERTEIQDWSNWPWIGVEMQRHRVVQPPRIFPDVTKFRNVDNAFLHQGISKDFAGIDNESVIFCKRFKIAELGASWILDDYLITECRRGATEESPSTDLASYYYCPDLKPKIEEDWYQIEFDQNGFRAWVGDIAARNDLVVSTKENREAICYRV